MIKPSVNQTIHNFFFWTITQNSKFNLRAPTVLKIKISNIWYPNLFLSLTAVSENRFLYTIDKYLGLGFNVKSVVPILNVTKLRGYMIRTFYTNGILNVVVSCCN